jgi:hypothetical protein
MRTTLVTQVADYRGRIESSFPLVNFGVVHAAFMAREASCAIDYGAIRQGIKYVLASENDKHQRRNLLDQTLRKQLALFGCMVDETCVELEQWCHVSSSLSKSHYAQRRAAVLYFADAIKLVVMHNCWLFHKTLARVSHYLSEPPVLAGRVGLDFDPLCVWTRWIDRMEQSQLGMIYLSLHQPQSCVSCGNLVQTLSSVIHACLHRACLSCTIACWGDGVDDDVDEKRGCLADGCQETRLYTSFDVLLSHVDQHAHATTTPVIPPPRRYRYHTCRNCKIRKSDRLLVQCADRKWICHSCDPQAQQPGAFVCSAPDTPLIGSSTKRKAHVAIACVNVTNKEHASKKSRQEKSRV